MVVIIPAAILVMCFRYPDVMTSVGLIAERVFPIILGLLLLLCFMLVGLSNERIQNGRRNIQHRRGNLPVLRTRE